MKRGDLLWLAALAAIIFLLLFPATHAAFLAGTKAHPYLMGFAKVAILATMGELLALRIGGGNWRRPAGLAQRAFVWGLLGISFVIVFDVFAGGVAGAAGKGLLPVGTGPVAKFATSLWISVLMNLAFAPCMMAFHRVTDTYIDLTHGPARKDNVGLRDVVAAIDWQGFVGFVVVRTIPLFWIPAHTITFLLPPEYRVLMAAFLSIALGAILAFAKRNQAAQAKTAVSYGR